MANPKGNLIFDAKKMAAEEGISPQAIYMRRWRAKNPETAAAYMSNWRRKRRERVLEHYGGVCSCCGEETYEFLSIDHINGGGTKHRAQVSPGGEGMVSWLINNDMPEGFQVLCHNCNQAKGFYGGCPHQREQ